MTVACIADTSTIHLAQDGSGTLTATLLGKGFGYIGSTGAQLLVDIVGATAGTIAAPPTGTVVAGTTSEQKWNNDRAYNLSLMGIQFAQITSMNVPAGELWTAQMRSNVNGAGFVVVAEQVVDNTAGGSALNAAYGPMVVPISTDLTPGTFLDVQIDIFLIRSGSGSGTINVGQTEMRHIVAWPSL